MKKINSWEYIVWKIHTCTKVHFVKIERWYTYLYAFLTISGRWIFNNITNRLVLQLVCGLQHWSLNRTFTEDFYWIQKILTGIFTHLCITMKGSLTQWMFFCTLKVFKMFQLLVVILIITRTLSSEITLQFWNLNTPHNPSSVISLTISTPIYDYTPWNVEKNIRTQPVQSVYIIDGFCTFSHGS